MGTRAVGRTYRLAWDLLEELLEGESNIRLVVQTLQADQNASSELRNVLDLVDEYLGGWRPNNRGASS